MPKITNENWSLRGVAITGLADSEDFKKVTFGKQAILDSIHTTLHYIDIPDRYREIEFMLWSDTWETDLLPWVASGVHALVTDFGSQGDYFIESATPERIYDRIACSGVYYWRVAMKLRKGLNGY